MDDYAFCPRCGTSRLTGTSFCRACRFNFEQPQNSPPATPPRSSQWGFSDPIKGTIGPPIARPKAGGGSRRTFVWLIIGALVLIIGVGIWQIGPSRFVQSLPFGAGGGPVNAPPAGQIWFGSSFDVSTFEIRGKTTTIGATSPFTFVAHLTRSVDASELVIRLFVGWSAPGRERCECDGLRRPVRVLARSAVRAGGTGVSSSPTSGATSWRRAR